MKAIILAGGIGSRLSEETKTIPKPLINIGHEPIIWHIMKIYEKANINDFILCLGYKGDAIKEYFNNYNLNHSDYNLNLLSGTKNIFKGPEENWNVSLINTGLNTMTGGRLLRCKNLIGTETFTVTYGDSLLDIDVEKLIKFHKSHGKLATLTGVKPSARFGTIKNKNDYVVGMFENKVASDKWINGGFFVLEPGVFDYINNDQSIWENEPLNNLANDGQLMLYKHEGFWQPMDTLKEKEYLNQLWDSGKAPWRVW